MLGGPWGSVYLSPVHHEVVGITARCLFVVPRQLDMNGLQHRTGTVKAVGQRGCSDAVRYTATHRCGRESMRVAENMLSEGQKNTSK